MPSSEIENGSQDMFQKMRDDFERNRQAMLLEKGGSNVWTPSTNSHTVTPDSSGFGARSQQNQRAPNFLRGFDSLRSGMFGPRPFVGARPFVLSSRERKPSMDDGASSGCFTSEEDSHSCDTRSLASTGSDDQVAETSSNSSYGETTSHPSAANPSAPLKRGFTRERIIPIRIEQDEEEEDREAAPPKIPPRGIRRETVAGGFPLLEEGVPEIRDLLRAQSCPPQRQQEVSTSSGEDIDQVEASAGGSGLPRLDVEAAREKQQQANERRGQKVLQKVLGNSYRTPMFFNSTPKPFSPEVRQMQAAPVFFRPKIKPTNGVVQDPRSIAVSPPPPSSSPPSPLPQPQDAAPRQIALKKIAAVLIELKSLKQQVGQFSGERADKTYSHLDEMLTRLMIRLDDVETGGDEQARIARKQAVVLVQTCLTALEVKGSNSSPEEPEERLTEELQPNQTEGLHQTEEPQPNQTEGLHQTEEPEEHQAEEPEEHQAEELQTEHQIEELMPVAVSGVAIPLPDAEHGQNIKTAGNSS